MHLFVSEILAKLLLNRENTNTHLAAKMLGFLLKVLILTLPIVRSNILVEVLKFKNIYQAVVFDCDASNQVLNHKSFNKNGFKISNKKIISNRTDTDITSNFYKVGLILNTSCVGWETIFKSLDQHTIFSSPFYWFIITNDLSSTSNALSELPIEVNSYVAVLTKFQHNHYQIYEVYNTGFYTHGKFKVNSLGYWQNSTLVMKDNKRMDLSGVVLKCMVVINTNVVNETVEEYVERSRPQGFDVQHKLKYYTMMKYLRDMYKFRYDLRRTIRWGYQHNVNVSSFDGLVGALQRKEVDVGCSPIFFRAERAKVVEYSTETWRSRQSFIFRHPKRSGAFYTIYTRPFSSTVWYTALGFMFFAALLLLLLLKLKYLRLPEDNPESTVSLAFLSIWDALCQQGTLVNRGSTSIKLLVFSTFFFTLILYQYYNATVVSTLLREPTRYIRTLDDLLKSDLKIGIQDVVFNYDLFRRTRDPTTIKLYHTKVVTSTQRNFFKPEYGMNLVKRGGFAFHVDSATGYKIMRKTFGEREICDIQEIELFPPQGMAAVMKQGTPYKETFAYGHRKIMEAGLAHRIRKIWDEPKPACIQTPDSSIFSVSIVDFGTALLTIVVGMLTSVAVLMCERGVYKMKMSHESGVGRWGGEEKGRRTVEQ